MICPPLVFLKFFLLCFVASVVVEIPTTANSTFALWRVSWFN